jgi:hypothetical protein
MDHHSNHAGSSKLPPNKSNVENGKLASFVKGSEASTSWSKFLLVSPKKMMVLMCFTHLFNIDLRYHIKTTQN